MNKNIDITEQLKCLIEDYDFNVETLSKYLALDHHQINLLAHGNINFLPDDHEYRLHLFHQIEVLYNSTIEEKDVKLETFLKVLLSYHKISKKTISKMSGVDIPTINQFLSLKKNKISIEEKYKLAITAMSLRFFLKDIENNSLKGDE